MCPAKDSSPKERLAIVPDITLDTVRLLIENQFPAWQHLPITPVEPGGHDNRTFRLGQDMAIRLPSHASYAAAVMKERAWLPVFARGVSLRVPIPIARGEPSDAYPLPWAINRWIEGEILTSGNIGSMNELALDLAAFLRELQAVAISGGVLAGEHNFHRGGDLGVYDEETNTAIGECGLPLAKEKMRGIWHMAKSARYEGAPLWVHGDVAVGNLIVKNGKLYGVIDFGSCGVGDPACDLVMAWNFFDGESRQVFLRETGADVGMVARAKGWALWKALITLQDSAATSEQKAWGERTLTILLDDGLSPS